MRLAGKPIFLDGFPGGVSAAKKPALDLMDWIAYLTMGVAGAAGLWGIPSITQRWVAFGILLLLGILRGRFWLSPGPRQPRTAHLYLLASLVMISGLLILSSSTHFIPILFFIWSVDAMLLFPLPLAVAWIASFSLVSGVNFVYRDGWESGLSNLLFYVCGYLFFGVFSHSLFLARAAQARSETLMNDLMEANRRLQEYAGKIEVLAVSQERNRLAREMHDTVGHHLTVSAVQLEAAQRLIAENPARAVEILSTVRGQVSAALGEIRRTVSRLREPLEAELPLPAALRQLALTWQAGTGIKVHADIQDDLTDFPPAWRLALYRAAQEALTNVQRHAGAKQVWLSLRPESDEVCLTVRDDGSGPEMAGEQHAAERHGFGLLGMQERAAQLGGNVRLEPWRAPDGAVKGARLVFCLPRKEDHG